MSSVVLIHGGCQTYNNQVRGMTAAWAAGQASNAAASFAMEANSRDKSKDSVVWHLEAGAALRAAENYQESNQHLDAAAAQMDEYEEKAKIRVAKEVGVVMSNQENEPYEGRSYDKIMAHTYRALNKLSVGEIENARPEIIRAYQCQQDAVEDNKRRIEKAQDTEKESKDRHAIDSAKADPAFSQSLAGVTKDCEGFQFYADYVNPFTVYLDGIYFLHEGAGGADLERARKSLKRVKEVVGNNKFIEADILLAESADGGRSNAALTYIIFETGQAASRDQVRFDIPIIFSRVSYIGAAFPKLKFHNEYVDRLTVTAGEIKEDTMTIANMDAIIALDFKNEWPVIISKTVFSTVTKAAIAYAINAAADAAAAEQRRKHPGQDQTGAQLMCLFTKMGTAVSQAAVNIADTRSWTTLPKQFQVARVPTPAGRKLGLSYPGFAPIEIALVDGMVNVVYVKSIAALSAPFITQFKLK